MGRRRSKPFWAKDYRKAAYNRQYYFKKKMQDKLASAVIMIVGGVVIFGWLFPSHEHALRSRSGSTIPTKSAHAQSTAHQEEAAANNVYAPDFNCAADHSKDSIATMLCQNSEAAKHELIFDQTYYALRQVVGKSGWKALKQEVNADDNVLAECLNTSQVTDGGGIPTADPACYIDRMDALTEKYKARLHGASLEEASRPIDQHIALQNNLISLGFLKGPSRADGIYGESTRAAILNWQKSHRDSVQTGFISDRDAAQLSSETEVSAPVAENVPEDTSVNMRHQRTSGTEVGGHDNQQDDQFLFYIFIFFALLAAVYACAKWMQRRAYDAAWQNVSKEIISQKLNLQIAKTQKLTKDQYGTLQTAAWGEEINYFIKTRLEDIINSGINNQKLRQKLKIEAINLIVSVASEPLPVQSGEASYISNPSVFDIRMNPFDYEQHCALILKNAGWDAYATQKSSDQGADVIAKKGNVRIVVQCKLYSGTVGNDAVQQAFSAQNFQGASGSIVATNSTFSQSARQIAATTGVILVHHTQLPSAAEEIYRRSIGITAPPTSV